MTLDDLKKQLLEAHAGKTPAALPPKPNGRDYAIHRAIIDRRTGEVTYMTGADRQLGTILDHQRRFGNPIVVEVERRIWLFDFSNGTTYREYPDRDTAVAAAIMRSSG